MITESYCSFEVAKLLKEKEFNEKTPASYHESGELQEGFGRWNTTPIYYSAPTLQMAMKFLRINHNILLFLLPSQENGKLVYLVEVWVWNEEEGIYESTYAPMPRKEPEEAVDAAIKYLLKNLI